MFTDKLVFLFLPIFLIVKTTEGAVLKVGDECTAYRSENGLKILIYDKKVEKEGKCLQALDITHPNGIKHKTLTIECVDNMPLEEENGNEYKIGKFLWSDKPESVFVEYPKGTLNWYQTIDGKSLGPQPVKAKKTKEVLEKLDESEDDDWSKKLSKASSKATEYINPSNWSGTSGISKKRK